MKVCMITGEYPPMIGGIGDYTAGLVAALPNETIVLTNRRAAGLRVVGNGRRHQQAAEIGVAEAESAVLVGKLGDFP